MSNVAFLHSSYRLGGLITDDKVVLQVIDSAGEIAGITLGAVQDNAVGQHLLQFQPPQSAVKQIVRYTLKVIYHNNQSNGHDELSLDINGITLTIVDSSGDSSGVVRLLKQKIAATPELIGLVTVSDVIMEGSSPYYPPSSSHFDIEAVAPGVVIDIDNERHVYEKSEHYPDEPDNMATIWSPSLAVIQAAREESPANRLRWNDGHWTTASTGAHTLTAIDGGTLVIDVDATLLPEVQTSTNVSIAHPKGNLLSNLSGIQVIDGSVTHACFYIKNIASSEHRFKVYLPSITAGDATLAIGFDPAGVGDGVNTGVATSIATTEDIPAGVVFSQPETLDDALQMDLQPDEVIAVWLQRSITGAERLEVTVNAGIAVGII